MQNKKRRLFEMCFDQLAAFQQLLMWFNCYLYEVIFHFDIWRALHACDSGAHPLHTKVRASV